MTARGPQLEIFHNTINLTGEMLQKARLDCAQQDVEVLQFFINNHTQAFTPWEVCDNISGLFTSIRRSITTLTAKGYLYNTGKQKAERYGRPNYTWKIKI
jgi:hypothetical protein